MLSFVAAWLPGATMSDNDMPDSPRLLWQNGLTMAGAVISAVALLFILSLLFFDLASAGQSPYLGLFTYLVFPGFLVLGIALIVAGLLIARWRARRLGGRSGGDQYYPRIDLSLKSHRRALTGIGLVAVFALPVIGLLSYEGYHYTDSNEFCGLVCHTVMEPQYTAHRNSPHARVECAECHIGEGASWYVKSKLSGVRQVIAVARDSYSRPIPPAITELRPARETCEQCHWPTKFFGDQLITINHVASDEANRHTQVRMLVKTGGSDASTGPPSGIHWHMTLGKKIEFVATDEFLQEIPWARVTDRSTGIQTVYRSDGRSADEPPPDGTRRTVDCMDCHNRATHIFRTPSRAVDNVLAMEPALRSLPFAKRELVATIVTPYGSKEEGRAGIAAALREFYQTRQPEAGAPQGGELDRLIEVGQQSYDRSFFPRMKVSWRTYPDNIGHLEFVGCLRCHDDKHVNHEGKPISRECSACHEFLVPADPQDAASLLRIGEFQHPVALEGVHNTIRCDRCHTGGTAPAATCAGCHVGPAQFLAGTLPALASFAIAADSMAGSVECQDCHDLSRPTNVETINEACMDCHDDEAERFEGLLQSWKGEVERLLAEAGVQADASGRRAIDALLEAGPLHNIEAARQVLSEVAGKGEQRGQ
jgi:hypothetical protein